MGNCSCADRTSQRSLWLAVSVPKPVVFSHTGFVFLHYTEAQTMYSSFENLKADLRDCVITEVARYLLVNAEEEKSQILVKGVCIEQDARQMLLVIEVLDGSLALEYGVASVLNAALDVQRGRLLTKFRPAVSTHAENMVAHIELLYKRSVEQSREVATTKSAMRFLRSALVGAASIDLSATASDGAP